MTYLNLENFYVEDKQLNHIFIQPILTTWLKKEELIEVKTLAGNISFKYNGRYSNALKEYIACNVQKFRQRLVNAVYAETTVDSLKYFKDYTGCFHDKEIVTCSPSSIEAGLFKVKSFMIGEEVLLKISYLKDETFKFEYSERIYGDHLLQCLLGFYISPELTCKKHSYGSFIYS